MADTPNPARGYLCPMHREIHQPNPGQCSKCGMDLVPENARFGLIRHMLGSPEHVLIMAAAMLAIMIAAMYMMR
ncbi:MAG TPA: heavy metal-binding domain-containing protein [Polyangiaceae bacterium]